MAFISKKALNIFNGNDWHAANIGFAARLAGYWSNGAFVALVLHPDWTYIVGLLFVNLYFYILNQHRFRYGGAMNSSPASKPCSLVPSLPGYHNTLLYLK
jgi:hypothetical protein